MKKFIIPILVLLNLVISCDKDTTTNKPQAPDTAMFFQYSIGTSNYKCANFSAVIYDVKNQLILVGQSEKTILYPSVKMWLTQPTSGGWKTSLKMDSDLQSSYLDLDLSQTITYSTKNVIPADTTGIDLVFTKFKYATGSVIEGTFSGTASQSIDPTAIIRIKDGKFRLRVE